MFHLGLLFGLVVLPVETSSTSVCTRSTTSSSTLALNCCNCRMVWPERDFDIGLLKELVSEGFSDPHAPRDWRKDGRK